MLLGPFLERSVLYKSENREFKISDSLSLWTIISHSSLKNGYIQEDFLNLDKKQIKNFFFRSGHGYFEFITYLERNALLRGYNRDQGSSPCFRVTPPLIMLEKKGFFEFFHNFHEIESYHESNDVDYFDCFDRSGRVIEMKRGKSAELILNPTEELRIEELFTQLNKRLPRCLQKETSEVELDRFILEVLSLF